MQAHRGSRWLVLLVAGVVGLTSWVGTARGQDVAFAGRGPRFLQSAPSSGAPVEIQAGSSAMLRRLVSLNFAEPTVGKLLGAIEQQTGLKFAYNVARLAPDRPVDLQAPRITVAAALTAILLDTELDVLLTSGNHVVLVERPVGAPVAAGAIVGRVTDAKTQTALAGATVVVQGTPHSATTGSDGRYRIAEVAAGTYTVRARYIGYAPGTASVTVSADQEATADLALEKSAQRLDEVVTTGTVVPTEVKALPTPVSILTSEDIAGQNLQRVDQVFRGQVPGVIAWDQGPINWFSTVAVRGTSTLSDVPTIKTFIDGVEMADPQYIATIDPNSIERIEITRGPQASTLYGAGAVNGVMQIFTKKGQFGLARPQVRGKLSAGGIGGFNGRNTAPQTDNSISVLGGGEKASFNLGGIYRWVGEWVPAYRSTDWGFSAGGQATQGILTISGSARYTDKRYDEPWDVRFRSYVDFSKPNFLTTRLRQQTYGVTSTAQVTPSWRHTLTLGYDQSYVALNQSKPRLTTPADSFLFTTGNHIAKASVLYHTDVGFRLGKTAGGIVTAGINYDAYDFIAATDVGATHTTGSLDGIGLVRRTPWSNTGYFGQAQFNLLEHLFLTAGLRAERNPNFGVNFGTAWSPRVGMAYVHGLGPAAVKLRASYGESIRAPVPGQRDASVTPFAIQLANPDLAPERQRGVDGGIEVYFGAMSFGMTYYNQKAIDLIQQVTAPSPDTVPAFQNENVSRVRNEGWEFEAHIPVGPLQLRGTYSITHSTVQELPPGFPPGELQVGDQLLGIPRSAGGITITYSPFAKTTLTASMTHIGHWTNIDFVSLYGFFFGGQEYRGSTRAYWMEYPPVTKFGLGISQDLSNGMTAFVRAENVGNTLRFEQHNLNIPTPRSVIVGATLRY